ncbi:MAG TPA: hypothetical protein PKN47_15795, partial [Nitrospira sp.]|nr:hypothetical protein [Nitrospira sp.]
GKVRHPLTLVPQLLTITLWDTQLAVNFESEYLKKFAKDLASLVRQAPPFDPNFPVVEAADNEVLSEGVIGRIADV